MATYDTVSRAGVRAHWKPATACRASARAAEWLLARPGAGSFFTEAARDGPPADDPFEPHGHFRAERGACQLSSREARIDPVSPVLFDAEEPVVLRDPSDGRGIRLDKPRSRDGEIRDRRVLGFARAVRDDVT